MPTLKDKKILIIHKSELISEHLKQFALLEGASVLSAITKKRIKLIDKVRFNKRKKIFKINNLESLKECFGLCEKSEIIFQLIDVYKPELDIEKTYRNFSCKSAIFSLNMIDAAMATGVKKIFFVNLDYQEQTPQDLPDDYETCLNKFLNDISDYRKNEKLHTLKSDSKIFKLLDKKMHSLFWHLLKLKIKHYQKYHSWNGAFLINTKNVFGPFDDFIPESQSVVTTSIAHLLNKDDLRLSRVDLEKRHRVIYSKDLAEKILLAAKEEKENFLEILGDEEVSIKDIIKTIEYNLGQLDKPNNPGKNHQKTFKENISETIEIATKKTSTHKFNIFIKDDPLNELKKFSGKFFSLGVIAFFPDRIIKCLEHLEESCFDPQNFEINIAIPLNPNESPHLEQRLVEYKKQSKMEIKIIKTPYDYWTSMHSHNKIIFESSDQRTYFHMNISDRYRFSSKNWDLIIKQFIGLVPDDIFFLRSCGTIKNLKPRSSLYEAWYKPDNWAIYTRKYLQAIGGFPSIHHAHDGSMEMVHYFVSHNKSDPFVRDIALPPTLLGIQKIIPSSQASKKNFYIRYCSAVPYYLNCYFSRRAIEFYKKSSIKIYLQHLLWRQYNNSEAKIIEGKKWVGIKLPDGTVRCKMSYRVSIIFAIKQKIRSLYSKTHGFNFAYRFHFLLRTEIGYNLLHKLITKERDNNVICVIILKLITRIFLCEPITNSILEKMDDDDFKEVMQGKEMVALKRSKLVWIDELAQQQLRNSQK